MITAVDTNILIEYRAAGSDRSVHARALLKAASGEGLVIICEIVYVELSAAYPERAQLDRFLSDLEISIWRTDTRALALAGRSWMSYAQRRPRSLTCPACGAVQAVQCHQCGEQLKPRQHVAADFMVGAHAVTYADQLLSRDAAVYRSYFPDLSVRY
ncbi:MAG: type II toxin-antitoxin system VapC family toxin [Chloroflexota bacterium]